MNEYIFVTEHTVLIEADNEKEAKEIYENLDNYGDISDVQIKEGYYNKEKEDDKDTTKNY